MDPSVSPANLQSSSSTFYKALWARHFASADRQTGHRPLETTKEAFPEERVMATTGRISATTFCPIDKWTNGSWLLWPLTEYCSSYSPSLSWSQPSDENASVYIIPQSELLKENYFEFGGVGHFSLSDGYKQPNKQANERCNLLNLIIGCPNYLT